MSISETKEQYATGEVQRQDFYFASSVDQDHLSERSWTRSEWLSLRKKAIGSSELGTILGLNPWSSPWEVWATKRGLLDDWEGNDATDAGRRLEGAVLDHAEQCLGRLKRNVYIHHADLPLSSTLDAMTEDWRPVEAKTTGIVGPIYGEWGDEETDQVPDSYLIQVHCQLICTRQDMAYLFALIPGRGFCEFHVERNETLHEEIGNRVKDWWERHIVQGHAPSTELLPSLDVVKRLRRTPNKVIEGTPELEQLWTELADARRVKTSAEKQAKETETQIRMLLGDAEAATLPSGQRLELATVERAGYTVEPGKYTQLKLRKVS